MTYRLQLGGKWIFCRYCPALGFSGFGMLFCVFESLGCKLCEPYLKEEYIPAELESPSLTGSVCPCVPLEPTPQSRKLLRTEMCEDLAGGTSKGS